MLLALVGPNSVPDFARLKGALTAAEPEGSLPGDAATSDLTLRSSSGLVLRVRVRLPPSLRGPAPAAIILGGLERGRAAEEIAAQVVGETPIILASLDYPYAASARPRGWQIVDALLDARPASYRTIAGARLLIDFLQRDPRVRPDRIILIGVSLGAPFAVAVGGTDPRVAAVAALFGTDLPTMIEQAVRPRVGSLAKVPACLAARHFRAIDARRLAAAIPPRPLLVVGGRGDRRIPPAGIEALAGAAAPSARMVWLDTPHPNPTTLDWLRLGGDVVRSWLAAEGLLN